MSTPLSLIAQGSFISGGVQRVIELPRQPHYFCIKNRSLWGTAPTAVVQSEWYNGYAAGQAIHLSEGGGSAITATATAAGGAGFTLIDLTNQTPGALVATGTAITNATPAVVTDATSPAVGDIVRMSNTTGMLQIAGMDFTVTAVNPGVTFTLGYLPAAGFAAAATNSDYRIIPAKYYSPARYYMTAMTAANPAVITVSVAHNYVVGDWINLHIPTVYGSMNQFDGRTVRITAVTVSTITVDLNSIGFAFAFPTSAIAAAGSSFAHVTPVGEVATILTSAMDNVGYYAMQLGTTVVGAGTNVMDWMALARDYSI
jgi:hypothetical protein